jgi:two-component system nitrogen regulation response regulator NtrX
LLRENSAVELFGSEEDGQVRYGLLEQANGGTLFLDEVGDMDLAVQARLFSVLEGRSYLRVGGNEPVKLDVRIVAATHRDLGQEVQAKRFRDDLYYQLAVVPLHVPPLRDHADDIPELLAHYVDIFVNQEGLPYRRFTVAAQNRLRHYGWPGNIRELKNLVQRLLILGSGGEIQAEEVDAALAQVAMPAEAIPVGQFTLPLREAREQFERAYFEYQLRQSDGSIGKVAKQAGMERTHLYRKLRGLGLNPKDIRLEDGE